jgi:hypothetical protein
MSKKQHDPLPPISDLLAELKLLDDELEGWLGKLNRPGVQGSHAVGMLMMAFGSFERLLRRSLALTLLKHNLEFAEVATLAHVGRAPLEKLPLGKVIGCLRAARQLRPAARAFLTDARLGTLADLTETRNRRIKSAHNKTQREEMLKLTPDALRQVRSAASDVLAPLLNQ